MGLAVALLSTSAAATGNYDRTGEASWYGERYHGRSTASGEIFDMNALTAAHRRLAFGTWVRVTNLANRRSLVVRITDRGPYARGRIIDLSRRAADLLGFERSGVARVRVETVQTVENIRKNGLKFRDRHPVRLRPPGRKRP